MNEGCEGGWSVFNGYLAENGHLVSESCAPYRGSTNGDSCKNYKKCQPIAKVENSYYIEVSNSENQINEFKIMKEMIRNGPVVGEFKAPNKFRYYDKGILADDGGSEGSSNLQLDSTLLQLDSSLTIATQNLDHSVMLMGWGLEPKSQMKVWIARNTFGPNWGEKGDFYIRRG